MGLETEYLTTKELAELLRIKERKVYELAASGEVPCSRATGKLLFPRAALDAWLAHKSSGFAADKRAERPAVLLGSHDPLLEWALREAGTGLASFFDGSLDGLERFARGEGLASALHVFNAATGEWNVPAVRARFAASPVVLVEFAWRQRGLIVSRERGERIRAVGDLRGMRVVPRQAGAGSQVLLEHVLGEAGLEPRALKWAGPARTETEAATAVLEDKADAAFGLMGLAQQYRLGFVPLVSERFDLLVERRAWFEEPLQRLADFCRSEAFAARAAELQGYDVSGFGRVHFNGP